MQNAVRDCAVMNHSRGLRQKGQPLRKRRGDKRSRQSHLLMELQDQRSLGLFCKGSQAFRPGPAHGALSTRLRRVFS